MERKTHILFTITGIYWLSFILRKYWIDSSLALWYISIVSSFPLISIPYQIIATTLPDSDWKTRLSRTLLAPAVFIIQILTSHRWATHDIRWITLVWLALYFLYLIWTNIIILALISFLAVTITIVLIDQFKFSFPFLNIRSNIVEYILSWIIIIFFPILLIPEVYTAFLISIFFWYVWHMFWDLPSKEWWKPLIINSSKFQIPFSLGFRVWWFVERYIILPILTIALIYIILTDRNFWWDKIIHDFLLVKDQYINIFKNPEILFNDLANFKEKIEIVRNFF